LGDPHLSQAGAEVTSLELVLRRELLELLGHRGEALGRDLGGLLDPTSVTSFAAFTAACVARSMSSRIACTRAVACFDCSARFRTSSPARAASIVAFSKKESSPAG